MAEWSFQRKLTSGVIFICLLAMVTSGASLLASRILIANMSSVAKGEGIDLAEAKALQLAGVKNIGDVEACVLSGGRQYAPAARAGSADVQELAARFRLRLTEPAAQKLLENVLSTELALRNVLARALILGGSSQTPAASLSPESIVSSGARFSEALTAFVAYVDSSRVTTLSRSRAAVSRAESLLVVITVATIALLALLCLVLIGALGRSYRVQSAARLVAEAGHADAKGSLLAAEATSQIKDEFLATVSHELRNPLAPILTWTQLLRSGTLDEEKTRRALEVIERNVNSQAQLIDDLVDVSRVVSGKFRLDVRPIDLVSVIKAAADAQAPASDAKQIRLQLVLDGRAGLISGDSERLQQVMWNLISNAIKFTPKNGSVQVVLQRAQSHVEVGVSDTGVGIDPDFLPHVFEPFQQATGGSMRRHGGLGLGLSIVRHIVELHGGVISAHSEGLDRGSKFTIKLPLLATTPDSRDPARRHPVAGDRLSSTSLGRLDGVRVLVVEDEPSAREALLELFSSCHAEARATESVAEALEIFEGWLPDVLVSDIAMPGEDGYSLIRKLRSRPPEKGGATPAVALTAYAKIDDRVTILSAGFQMYLSKPANPNELVAVVSSLAKRDDKPRARVVI